MPNVCDCWLDATLFDKRFEFAVRAWALQSDTVRGVVQGADTARLEVLSAMFFRFGYAAQAA